MGFSLNQAVKPQTEALNEKAVIRSSESTPKKRPYVEGKKPNFSRKDIIILLKNMGKLYKLPISMNKTVKLIQKDTEGVKRVISQETFEALTQMLTEYGVDDFGFFEVTPEKLFNGCGIPHKYALVFSTRMDPKAFINAPNIECQLEVASVYSKTGNVANQVSTFLQNNGFGASPNHSMGGQLDYSMAIEWAGIGITGRHSMAMTKKNGPCHRVFVVYTNIENLNDFIHNTNEDMQWIHEFCKKCGKCIRSCPTNAILTEPLQLDGIHPTKIIYEKCAEGFSNYGCGICIKSCPFTFGNYEKIKEVQR